MVVSQLLCGVSSRVIARFCGSIPQPTTTKKNVIMEQGIKKTIDNKYYIRIMIYSTKNRSSEVGLLSYDYGVFSATQDMREAWDFGSYEEAQTQIKRIINEEPATYIDNQGNKKIYPPHNIDRICAMSKINNSVSFRLSIIRIDIQNITINELDYYTGRVSFENPEIKVMTSKTFKNEPNTGYEGLQCIRCPGAVGIQGPQGYQGFHPASE